MSAALSAPARLAPTRCSVCRAELERMSKSALAPVETEMTSWEREASGRAVFLDFPPKTKKNRGEILCKMVCLPAPSLFV